MRGLHLGRVILKAARADYFPELIAETSGAGSHVIDRSYNPTSTFQFTLGIRWSVFEGFNRKYRILDAIALEKAALEEMRAQQLSVITQVFEDYYRYKSAISQLEANRASLKASEEAYNAIQLGYQVGTTNIVEVLQSLSELSDAREALVQSQASVYIELAKLTQSTGSLPRFVAKK